MVHRSTIIVGMLLALSTATAPAHSQEGSEGSAAKEEGAAPPDKDHTTAEGKIHWRKDPTLPRRPGSYISLSTSWVQSRAWAPENDDHDDLSFGPMRGLGLGFRVGDAFADWIAVGFQVAYVGGTSEKETARAIELLLDVTLYPVAGLGIRPSVGIGLGFATGEHEWEFGGGGPGCLSMSFLYEFRLLRLLSIAPVVSASWITGEEFDALFITVGVELSKWFLTATS